METIDIDDGTSNSFEEAPSQPSSRRVLPSTTTQDTQELEKQIADLRKEKDEIYDRLLRKQADFENYRKRIERDKREFQAFVLSDFISELLVILDNFERAF